MKQKWFLLLIVAVSIITISSIDYVKEERERNRQITVYNTYAYQDGDEWVMPVKVWVHQKRRWLQGITSWTVRIMGEYNPQEMNIFRERLTDLLADSKWRRDVTFTISEDPNQNTYQITDPESNPIRTDRNGNIRGSLRIHADSLSHLVNDESGDVKLTLEASARRYTGKGMVNFMQPEGLSVVSDIDDTVKETEIPAGSQIVVRNTFFIEYSAAEGMAELYSTWSDASFHYVSGSPWQLYRSLSGFLFSDYAGFPEGTFHMKNARKNVTTISSWRDLTEFVTNENLTFEQKLIQIDQLFKHFPERKFILVGDSGERDPDIYRALMNKYPDQVREVFIRDVVNSRELNPDRIEGMTIIPATTIEFGVSSKRESFELN